MSEGYDCYTRTVLWMYDVQVHWFNDNFAWRCPRPVLQAFFDANAGPRHMDIGPGTGLFLAEHRGKMQNKGVNWPQQLAFVDMNPNCLQAATARVNQSINQSMDTFRFSETCELLSGAESTCTFESGLSRGNTPCDTSETN
ncbi:hypothetical protein BO86DRAFT_398278 [Aspergillus japonicus CBS 114.51]|uniref:Methyltransferase domain-containing protein n=1 Tax=Aspergillus japonicus CBS 114.51 TaxID=1448312 RepID=A0A8T8X5E8_ASPJA|nr:hypothetical protein BO86DRAFT_398278 [Aspergillus japonicus CBS 114.51]RAH83245.1 hypothetical protein BO86DRAFT_398278 [Aspergillus japonicus CBS 114.51]